MTDPPRIRKFSIVAHIDHGKTTLSDRILEITGALSAREMTEQVLDDNPIERWRGIPIKARSVSLKYRANAGARAADAPNRLPRDSQRPHDRPVHQQGRPAVRRPRDGARADRGDHRKA